MSKRQSIFALIVSAVVFSTISPRQGAQTINPGGDEATVVDPGQVTDKQREYSREYKKMYSSRNGRKLNAVAERAKMTGGKGEAGVAIGVPSIPTVGEPMTAEEVVTDLSCKADVIVRGIPQRKTAYLTEDETFVFNEYDFSVKEVLKNNASLIGTAKGIQITRPGGLIMLNDQLIRVEDRSYNLLELRAEYLLFLKYVALANGFIVADARGDFRLNGDSFSSISGLGVPGEIRNGNSENLLKMVQVASGTGCPTSPAL